MEKRNYERNFGAMMIQKTAKLILIKKLGTLETYFDEVETEFLAENCSILFLIF